MGEAFIVEDRSRHVEEIEAGMAKIIKANLMTKNDRVDFANLAELTDWLKEVFANKTRADYKGQSETLEAVRLLLETKIKSQEKSVSLIYYLDVKKYDVYFGGLDSPK